MPPYRMLIDACVVAVCVSVLVVLIMSVFGLAEHAPIPASVTAAVSATIVGSRRMHDNDEPADARPS